ncbi:hypothetical protein TNCV_2799311 [Trichonephila clavipes]|nr:hypothetical protein TNCV_2799311 [Trichonephila clavipes]
MLSSSLYWPITWHDEWEAIGYTFRSPVDGIDGPLKNAQNISRMLRPVALTFILFLRNPTFKQDNALPHFAGIVRICLDTENVRQLSCPARSPINNI